MNHTPGPWRILEPDQVRGPEGQFVADCECNPNVRMAVNRANALLIAAAPDMLAALETALEYWANGTCVRAGSDLANDIKAIVDKANG